MRITRASKTPCSIPVIPLDAPLAVRKLALGCRGWQYTSGISQQKDEEVRSMHERYFVMAIF